MALKSQWEGASLAAGVISAVVAVVTGATAFYTGQDFLRIAKPVAQQQELESQVKSIKEDVRTLKSQLAAAAVASSASGPMSSDAVSRQLQSNAAALSDLGGRLQRLEQAILATPAKALEISLLQRDMESLKLAQIAQTATLKDSVDRVYDQNKWLLGGVSVSILALGVSSFLRATLIKSLVARPMH